MTYDPNLPPQNAPPDPNHPQSGIYAPQYAAMYGYGAGYGAPMKHSGVGVASFIIALIAIVSQVALIVVAAAEVMRNGGKPNPQSPTLMIVGCSTMIAMLAAVVGLILGIIAANQSNRKRVFGIIGLCLNLGYVLLIGVLLAIGFAHKH